MRTWNVALALALPVLAGATEFVNPRTGYVATVPDGFQQRYDQDSDTFWMAARGGVRVRVETREHDGPLSGRAAGAWYKKDGMALKSSTPEFRVLRKPVPDESFGPERRAYMYAFGYSPGPSRALGYVGDGSSQEEGRQLQIRVLAYGAARALQAHQASLDQFLATLKWPTPASDGPVDAGTPGGTQVATISDPATVVDPVDDIPPPPRRDPPPRPTYKAEGEFDRGSASGGLGGLSRAGVVQDEKLAKALAARRAGMGKTRTDEQRDRSAKYLGFLKKK